MTNQAAQTMPELIVERIVSARTTATIPNMGTL